LELLHRRGETSLCRALVDEVAEDEVDIKEPRGVDVEAAEEEELPVSEVVRAVTEVVVEEGEVASQIEVDEVAGEVVGVVAEEADKLDNSSSNRHADPISSLFKSELARIASFIFMFAYTVRRFNFSHSRNIS
jgi:hypothetical protein